PAPAPAIAPPPSLAALYDRAEDRLQNGDAAGARAALQAILDAHVDAPEVPLALLELARLQLAAGDSARALALLATLAERTDAGPLAAPATYLRCVALTDRDRAAARACFTELRATFPRSVHAIDATARLAILAADDGDCAAAVPLIDAYLARRATGDLAIALRARRARCAP
ncbi:MAG: outer membrane protein assembly factor BamD, partial [Deltaproteobacteria bacterium]|nr:outer membrane protein assembly factor BamD [Deltaproteobacteria bacterium]